MSSSKKLPAIIYKYSRLNEYFFQHLIKNEFWFSRPHEFNDPYDCNIGFSPKPAGKEKQFEQEYYDLANINRKDTDGFSIEETTKFMKSRVKTRLINENKVIEDVKNKVGRTGICCFSATKNNLLMWAHYSDAHKGVCVGYSSDKLVETYEQIYWVKYGKKFPIIEFEFNHYASIPNEIMIHKSSDWKYEKEIRIIGQNGLHSFKRKTIKEIIFGLNTPVSQIRAIMALLFQLDYKHVELKQVIISDNEYQVKFKRLSPAEETN